MASSSWSVMLLFLYIAICQACSPPQGLYQEYTMHNKTLKSPIVISGFPTKMYPDPDFPGGDVYSVDFRIVCIFKGAPLPEYIRVRHVGQVPGLCQDTSISKLNEQHLFYLRNDGESMFVPEYSPDKGSMQYMEEVVVVCDATVSCPTGISCENSCPSSYDYDDCLKTNTEAPNTGGDNKDKELKPPPPPNGNDLEPPPPPNDLDQKDGTSTGGSEPKYNPVVEGNKEEKEDDGDRNSSPSLLAPQVALLLLTTLFLTILNQL